MKFFLQSGALFGALSVALGAFGAHAFKAALTASGRLDTYETAVKYQFYHALALVLIAVLLQKPGIPGAEKFLHWSGYAFIAGILIFSGSLYILCLTGITKFGAITPIGGLFLIAGWVCLMLAAGKYL